MKTVELANLIINIFPGFVPFKEVIRISKEILDYHGDDGLHDYRTSNPFELPHKRQLELKYYQNFYCPQCDYGDEIPWCEKCGGTGKTAPAEVRFLRIWLSKSNELVWG